MAVMVGPLLAVQHRELNVHTKDMRKCPPNAQNEYTMAVLSSTENEVYSETAAVAT
jgi:hypothetical protein